MAKQTIDSVARALGYTIERGAYHGTSDDRADRWYPVQIDGTVVDRRGEGYATKRDALNALRELAAPSESVEIVEIVRGQSGEYIVVRDRDGRILRDDRPWQMRV